MKLLNLICALAILSTLGGCGPTELNLNKKPSYADLVVTYNAEVQTLDRLEGKRKELIAEYVGQAQKKAMQGAISALESGATSRIPDNPNQALDQAVATAELQAQLQSGLLENLGQSSNSGSTLLDANGEYPQELKSQLAELDGEIAAQKERVERARNARDAAEPK